MTGSTYQLEGKVVNEYEIDSSNIVEIKGLKAALKYMLVGSPATDSDYKVINYSSQIGFPYLKQSINTSYDYAGDTLALSTITENTFNTGLHHQIVSSTVTNSDSTQVKTTEYSYPLDYSSSGAMGYMQSKHMIGMPVETRVWDVQEDGRYLIGYGRTDFDLKFSGGDTCVYPLSVYTADIADPVNENDFNASPQNYIRKVTTYYAYDDYGHPVTIGRENSNKSAVIYERDGLLPIARISNASYDEVAYTSFESNDFGNWAVNGGAVDSNEQRTGIYSLTLQTSVSIVKEDLPTGTYELSYWQKGGNVSVQVQSGNVVTTTNGFTVDGWQLVSSIIEITSSGNSITLTGTGKIDELRLKPENAMMTTTNYDQFYRKIDQTDNNHVSAYYDYDIHNRLLFVRDQDHNIVKQYTHHFAEN